MGNFPAVLNFNWLFLKLKAIHLQLAAGSPCSLVELIALATLGATSHTRLKAPDRGNVRALIGWKGGDRPSSLHTRRSRPKGPKKSTWIKRLHGVLHGELWIKVHGLFFSYWCPPRPTSKKLLPLYSWRLLDYKSHIQCTSPSRPKIQYICSLPLSK